MSDVGYSPIVITGVCALTPAGEAEQTCASIRANLSRMEEYAGYRTAGVDPVTGEQEPLVAARVEELELATGGPERLLQLLVPTLTDLAEAASLRPSELRRCALLIALPGPDAAVDRWDLGDGFAPEVAERTDLEWKRTQVSQGGHAGVIELLREAAALLARGEVESCVVAGVDSYLSYDRLEHLDQAYRLKSARNVDGFFPGEAAVALLVESPHRAGARPALGRVTAVGTGNEKELMTSEKPSSGAGLTEALRAVLPASGGAPWVLCDLNGESYRSFEWGIAVTRLGERLGPVKRLVHPASSIGDVGAASGGLLVAAALAGLRRGYAAADEATIWASSDGPLRAAARITRA